MWNAKEGIKQGDVMEPGGQLPWADLLESACVRGDFHGGHGLDLLLQTIDMAFPHVLR